MSDDTPTEPTEDGLHCPRCAKLMPVDRPHRGFAIAYRAWMGVVAICVMCTPDAAGGGGPMLPATYRFDCIDVVRMGRYAALGPFRRPQANDRRLVAEAMEQLDITHLAKAPLRSLSLWRFLAPRPWPRPAPRPWTASPSTSCA